MAAKANQLEAPWGSPTLHDFGAGELDGAPFHYLPSPKTCNARPEGFSMFYPFTLSRSLCEIVRSGNCVSCAIIPPASRISVQR